MQLTGRENSRLSFTHEAAQLAPGRNELTLFCPVSLVVVKSVCSTHRGLQSSSAGTYTLSSTEISIARLHFQWKHTKTPKQIRAGNMPALVHIPKDLKALDVRLKQPPLSESSFTPRLWTFCADSQIVELGTSSRIMVILSTGRNDIATAQVKLSAPSGIQFKYEEAELSGDGE